MLLSGGLIQQLCYGCLSVCCILLQAGEWLLDLFGVACGLLWGWGTWVCANTDRAPCLLGGLICVGPAFHPSCHHRRERMLAAPSAATVHSVVGSGPGVVGQSGCGAGSNLTCLDVTFILAHERVH